MANLKPYIDEILLYPEDIWVSPAHTWTGASSVSSALSTVWVDGQEDPDTTLSGSNSSSGTTQTGKTLTVPATYGGKKLEYEFEAVVDGSTLHRWVLVTIAEHYRGG